MQGLAIQPANMKWKWGFRSNDDFLTPKVASKRPRERERERERESERFCKCDAKWLEHSQRCSGCDSAKIFLKSKSRDTKKGSWKWASEATMMILICHALMQAGFCWVETSFKDRRCIEDMATIVVTTNTLSRANRKPCVGFLTWRNTVDRPQWTSTHQYIIHPLDAHYNSVVDEPQLPHLSLYLVSPWLPILWEIGLIH